jgi:hypothetical protein
MTLEGWVPVAITTSVVKWRYLPGHCFTDPFFEDTVRRHHGTPARTTTLEEATDWLAACPGLAPSGLVFHMSRCGSTLVAQMLAAVEENRVMAEPPALDDVLRQRSSLRLRTIVAGLGQPAAAESRYFLKLDCWHILDYELIREAFPDTPVVFLYRDPLEVLVSQMRNPGQWTAQMGVDREAQIAAKLGEIMEAALRYAIPRVDYAELPNAVFGMFGISWTAAQQEKMRQAAKRDSKSPNIPFQRDTALKRAIADDRIRTAAVSLDPLYRTLTATSQSAHASTRISVPSGQAR